MKNCDWTKPYYGISHRIVDGLQMTIEDRGTFVEAWTHSWITHTSSDKTYFFKRKLGHNEPQKGTYWGCGERYVKMAKHWLEGCEAMPFSAKDMSHFTCKELKNVR